MLWYSKACWKPNRCKNSANKYRPTLVRARNVRDIVQGLAERFMHLIYELRTNHYFVVSLTDPLFRPLAVAVKVMAPALPLGCTITIPRPWKTFFFGF